MDSMQDGITSDYNVCNIVTLISIFTIMSTISVDIISVV